MTNVLMAVALVLTGPPAPRLSTASTMATIDLPLPDATGAPKAVRIDRDRIATEQAAASRNTDAALIAKWRPILLCESGGNWASTAGKYEGGLQFLHSTWVANGGRQYAEHAYDASPMEQIAVAERVLASAGWSAWPVCSRRAGYR